MNMASRIASLPSAVTFGVMARAPLAGKCKTRLAATLGADAAARLYEAMLIDTLERLGQSALAMAPLSVRLVILAAPEHDGALRLRRLADLRWEIVTQRGADLGERLSNGLLDLARPGDLVCLTDSDSPTLPLEVLTSLATPRPSDAIVLGPCDDGGYYLIGMRSAEPRVFQGIPWSTPGVTDATRRACDRVGRPLEELRTWYDVDGHTDLERLARELHEQPERAPRTAEVLSQLMPASQRSS